jgi:hypothetical protein
MSRAPAGLNVVIRLGASDGVCRLPGQSGTILIGSTDKNWSPLAIFHWATKG